MTEASQGTREMQMGSRHLPRGCDGNGVADLDMDVDINADNIWLPQGEPQGSSNSQEIHGLRVDWFSAENPFGESFEHHGLSRLTLGCYC